MGEEGREREREGGREGRNEGGKEGGREEGREGGKERGRKDLTKIHQGFRGGVHTKSDSEKYSLAMINSQCCYIHVCSQKTALCSP